jgi:hypothetical protein
MIFELHEPKQAHAAILSLWPKIKSSLEAGNKLILEVKTASKSREQEEKYHAIIGDIAKQAQHLGAKWDAEGWKRLLVDQFCKDEGIPTGKVIPSLDGAGIIQLGFQTRTFTKEQASAFVEWLLAWAAENGIDTQ